MNLNNIIQEEYIDYKNEFTEFGDDIDTTFAEYYFGKLKGQKELEIREVEGLINGTNDYIRSYVDVRDIDVECGKVTYKQDTILSYAEYADQQSKLRDYLLDKLEKLEEEWYESMVEQHYLDLFDISRGK